VWKLPIAIDKVDNNSNETKHNITNEHTNALKKNSPKKDLNVAASYNKYEEKNTNEYPLTR
jgi:hypothetical protein